MMVEARANALDALGVQLRPKEMIEAFKRTSDHVDARST